MSGRVWNRGFTLVETALAISLFAMFTLPIVGLLTAGATEAQKAGHQRVTAKVRADLRLRLRDPGWPGESLARRDWSAVVGYDRAGGRLDDASRPWLRAELRGMEAPGFVSDRFEAVAIRISNARTGVLMDEAVLQRRKEVR